MFTEHVFTTIVFLDFGKNGAHAPDDHAYAYGLDDNWAAVYSAHHDRRAVCALRVNLRAGALISAQNALHQNTAELPRTPCDTHQVIWSVSTSSFVDRESH
jgi:hypothetical protein